VGANEKTPPAPRRRRAAATTAPDAIVPGKLYSEAEWSLFTKKDRRTWAGVRARGELPYLKVGASVRYRGEDLLKYLEQARAS